MSALAREHVSGNILKTLVIQRLPVNVQHKLLIRKDALNYLAKISDKINEVSEITPVNKDHTISALSLQDFKNQISILSHTVHKQKQNYKSERNFRGRSSSRSRTREGRTKKTDGKLC
ncbi:hypothetical protein NPIL_140491 [Nephila pilipes]|uniref:Uncharacterized protein n=1 Tax=Nephila pilipes TaxID=299642 RepID=A0A8X6N0B3_NEPPI|nr:hypothetical protein NPIL_140491 [Nephila pilipes]